MKKILMLSGLILCICAAGFANDATHTAKKKSNPTHVKHQQKKTVAYMDCYLNFDTSETCCDGAVVINGTGTITYDCMSGEVESFFYFYDANGCWYGCA